MHMGPGTYASMHMGSYACMRMGGHKINSHSLQV